MHSPHLTQRRRKSSSEMEPGGLITRCCGDVFEVIVLCIIGRRIAPARALSISLRRLMSRGIWAELEGFDRP